MAYASGRRMACMLPNMPRKPKSRMKTPATVPPSVKDFTIVRGSFRKARSVRTGSKKG